MVLKGNQPSLLREAEHATTWPARRTGEANRTRVRHGRLERRTLVAASAQDLGWPFARQVLRLHRRFVSKRTSEVLSDETVYAVTSLRREHASPGQLLELWQAHWRVESLHWVRDVVFGEDRSTTRTAHAPQALAAFRNLAISFIHRWRGPPGHRRAGVLRRPSSGPVPPPRPLGHAILNQPFSAVRPETQRLRPATHLLTNMANICRR